MVRRIFIIVGLAVLALLSAGCRKESSAPTSTATAAEEKAPERAGKAKTLGQLGPPYETHILFTGLCALNHPPKKAVKEVVLPSVFHHAHAAANGMAIPDHIAFIAIDTDVVTIDVEPKTYTNHKANPNIHNIRVYELPPSLKLHVDGPPDAPLAPVEVEEPSCMQTDGNLYYIPRMNTLLKPDMCLAAGIAVAATFVTDRGSFRSWVLDDHVKDFRVGDATSPIVHSQRTAQVADWTFNLPAQTLTLKDSDDKDFLVIRGVQPNVPIAIVAGAAEKKDLFAILDYGKSPNDGADEDHHFDVYYDRCQHPAHRAIPYTGAACQADWPFNLAYWPVWMTRDWPRMVKPGAMEAIAGGFNCGPDQFP